VAARDPEPGVDDVFVLAEAMRLHRFLERLDGFAVALLQVADAAEVRERVEVIERALVDVLDHAAIKRLGLRIRAAIEMDRAAEEECVAIEVGVEKRRVL